MKAFIQDSHINCNLIQPLTQWVKTDLPTALRQPDIKTDHLPTLNVEV
jgi:hypothetical protein